MMLNDEHQKTLVEGFIAAEGWQVLHPLEFEKNGHARQWASMAEVSAKEHNIPLMVKVEEAFVRIALHDHNDYTPLLNAMAPHLEAHAKKHAERQKADDEYDQICLEAYTEIIENSTECDDPNYDPIHHQLYLKSAKAYRTFEQRCYRGIDGKGKPQNTNIIVGPRPGPNGCFVMVFDHSMDSGQWEQIALRHAKKMRLDLVIMGDTRPGTPDQIAVQSGYGASLVPLFAAMEEDVNHWIEEHTEATLKHLHLYAENAAKRCGENSLAMQDWLHGSLSQSQLQQLQYTAQRDLEDAFECAM